MEILSRPGGMIASGLYLLAVAAIAVWSARRTKSAKDFFIAGQGVGLFVTGFATMSAAFSGFIFLGGPGLTYRMGVASFLISMPLGFTAAMLCWVLAKRLRLLAEVREIYTVPDAVLARFGSRGASGLAAVAVLVGTVGYLGAQLLALGRLVEAIFGTRELLGPASLGLAMAAGLLVVLAYSVAGGMVAGVYTDLLQGSLMLVAAVAVFGYAFATTGGPVGLARSLASPRGVELFGEGFLEPLGTVPIFTAFGFFFVFGVGTLGQPHMLHKFYMLKDPRSLRWMPWVLGGSQSLCFLIWLGIGLAVPALVADGRLAPLATPDGAAPAFLLGYVPEVLAGLVFAGILAAIMSTADSFANIASAALVRDLPRALGREVADELGQLRAARWATVGVMVAAAAFAYLYDDLIALLGTFAFGTFGAALGPCLAVGLNWKRVTAAAAKASIATGVAVNLGLEALGRQTLWPGLGSPLAAGALPTAAALAASLTVLFAVTAWTTRGGRQPPLPLDVAAVMDA